MTNAINVKYLKENVPHLIYGEGINFGIQSAKNLGYPTDIMSAVNVNYLVRLLGEVMYTIYKDIAPPRLNPSSHNPKMSKEGWIDFYVVNKYFRDPHTKVFRSI